MSSFSEMVKQLEQEPIPPETLQAALDHLIDIGAIPTTAGSRGQTWLAKKLNTRPRNVRRWLAGDSRLSGMRAEMVRMVLGAAMEDKR